MSACVPVCGLRGVSCEVSCMNGLQNMRMRKGSCVGGGGALNRTMRLKKISLFFPSAFLSRARALKAKCQVRKFRRSWIIETWDF